MKKAEKVKTKVAGSSVVLERLAKLIADNAEKFKDFVISYQLWLVIEIKMLIVDVLYECFRIVLAQDTKFEG